LRIDLFNHFIPQPYLEALQQRAPAHPLVRLSAGLRPLWDMEERLRMLAPWPDLQQVVALGQPTPELVAEGDFLVDSGRRAALRLLDLPDRPTAILASNDNMAVGAMQAARARGLGVPEDLSVVGYDDLEKAGIVTPPLTTVRQPLAELGRTAVSLLMRLVDGQRVEALHVELAAKLVVRETTAPPRR